MTSPNKPTDAPSNLVYFLPNPASLSDAKAHLAKFGLCEEITPWADASDLKPKTISEEAPHVADMVKAMGAVIRLVGAGTQPEYHGYTKNGNIIFKAVFEKQAYRVVFSPARFLVAMPLQSPKGSPE